jgi:two-component system chemotaxis response regulator CheY
MAVGPNMKFLIVDDYNMMLLVLRKLLKKLNFNNVEEATDGGMASEKLCEQGDINFIISDWIRNP